jgi:hypothetical protein
MAPKPLVLVVVAMRVLRQMETWGQKKRKYFQSSTEKCEAMRTELRLNHKIVKVHVCSQGHSSCAVRLQDTTGYREASEINCTKTRKPVKRRS